MWGQDNKLREQFTDLQKAVNAYTNRISSLEKENEDYRLTVESFADEKSKYERKLIAYESKVKELEDKITKTESSVKAKVTEGITLGLQTIGVKEFLSDAHVETESGRNAYQIYSRMPNGKEKTEYYNKHESDIKKCFQSRI